MQLTPIETTLWAEHRDFFCPDGLPNEQAFEAYLSKYAIPQDYPHVSPRHQHLIGAVLKNAPERTFHIGFAPYYRYLRADSQSSQAFDDWLGQVAQGNPLLLQKALKHAAPLMDFTEQIMVLRDAAKWFPDDDIKEYAAAKLLKTKPTVVMKQFNPVVDDMPHLLAMSASLMAQADPQCKALGDTIARGCFIARYGMAPETDPASFANDNHRPRPSEKYCTPAALGMLIDHGIFMDPADLIAQVQLRYKAASVTNDALAYPVRVFEDETSSKEHRAFASQVLDTVLTSMASTKGVLTNGAMSALVRIHQVCPDAGFKHRIEQKLVDSMFINGQQMGYALKYAAGSNPKLLDFQVATILQRVPDVAVLDFYYGTLLNPRPPLGTVPFSIDLQNFDASQGFFNALPASKIEAHVSHAMQTVFKHHKEEYRATELFTCMSQWTALHWSEDQRKAFTDSPMASTLILVYLYLAASGQRKYMDSTHSGGVPNIAWAPLPLLEKFYPEKKVLWNQMKLGLLQMPVESEEASLKNQYERVMASMFNLFSNAFLPEAPTFAAVHGMIEALDASPLDYFVQLQKNTTPALTIDLPTDMFEFN